MSTKKLGKQTIKFANPPTIVNTASIVGPKEAEGPLSQYFDELLKDEFWGEDTWEKAESKIIKETVNKLLYKSDIKNEDIDYLFAGDLLNQCISSSFGLRETKIPFFGLYGACSTMVEGMSLGSIIIDGGFADNVIATTSSHFCSAEKQFRFPLELGTQRPPSAQWTVTGAGACLLSSNGNGPYITHVTTGKIIDMGIKDGNNMGAAMAPAACDTLETHFKDTGRTPNYYDLIISGDLGYVGREIVIDLLNTRGIDVSKNFTDCGVLIFDKETQDTHSGGSGCGCCASVFSGYLFNKLQHKEYTKILLMATGALMNSTTSQQGESIPGIAHAISIELNKC